MNQLIIKENIITPYMVRIFSSAYNWDVLKRLFSIRKLDAQGFQTGQEAAFLSLLEPEHPTFRVVYESKNLDLVFFGYFVDITELKLSDKDRLLLYMEIFRQDVSMKIFEQSFIVSGNLEQLKKLVVHLCSPGLSFPLRYIGNWLVYDFTKQHLDGIFQDYIRFPYSDGTFLLKNDCK